MLANYLMSFLRFFRKNNFINKESDPTNRTVDKWAKSDEVYVENGFKIFWETLAEIEKYQNSMISNGKNPLEYVFSFFSEEKVLTNLVGLNIGCNLGENVPSILLAKTRAFSKIVVVDISKELLNRQSDITNQMGLNHIIEYQYMDLNQDSLQGENCYDFVFSLGTIHHIQRLEGVFQEINTALKKDGIFCMREYIGPSYLQFNDHQIDLINRMLAKIPDNLKVDANGNIKRHAWKPTLEEILADDPSEAVRSGEIMDILKMHLNIKQCNMTGGTLLDSLLHGIAGNFEKTLSAKIILQDLINEEKELIEKKVIPSDYVFVIAKKADTR